MKRIEIIINNIDDRAYYDIMLIINKEILKIKGIEETDLNQSKVTNLGNSYLRYVFQIRR